MRPQSEYSTITLRGLLIAPVCRLVLPFLLWRYKGFWGLREAAARKGGLIAKCYFRYCGDFNAEIPLSVTFDGPPCLPHGLNGILIANHVHIGRNVTIFQQVTIGQNTFGTCGVEWPRYIGNNVYIGAGAKIIGGVTIGENCRIGANCCVYKDLPANSVAVMSPTRVIQKFGLVNKMHVGGKTFNNGFWV